MRVACHNIAEFLEPVGQQGFLASKILQSAVIREMTVLGEAAKSLSAEFRDAHPEVAWRDIAGFRDLLVDAYHRISLERVWEIGSEDVPALLTFIDSVLPQFEE